MSKFSGGQLSLTSSILCVNIMHHTFFTAILPLKAKKDRFSCFHFRLKVGKTVILRLAKGEI